MYIREATNNDVPAISNLITKLARKHIAPTMSESGLEKLIDSMSAEAIHTYFEKGYHYHVGLVHGEIVGVISIRDKNHLFHLFVKEEFQGNGYASNLWKVAKAACDDSCSPITFTVNSSINAQHIYKKWGFVPLSGVRESCGIKDIPMKFEQ